MGRALVMLLVSGVGMLLASCWMAAASCFQTPAGSAGGGMMVCGAARWCVLYGAASCALLGLYMHMCVPLLCGNPACRSTVKFDDSAGRCRRGCCSAPWCA